jgi:sulfide:quinone oxidoreductase
MPVPSQPIGHPHVVVAGSGPAALEAVLALRALGSDQVAITMVTPASHFEYRPLSVLEAFEAGTVWRLELARFAADQDVTLRRASVARVDAGRRRVRTADGADVPYTRLLMAVGARAIPWLPGALPFPAGDAQRAFRAMLDDIAAGRSRRIAFVPPPDAHWSLPLYELALLTAGRAREVASGPVELLVATPEEEPLQDFGEEASRLVRDRFADSDIGLVTGTTAVDFSDSWLRLGSEARLPVDHVVALQRREGRAIRGLPSTHQGFLPVDDHMRVPGRPEIFAAGDGTAFRIKQGGIATQQADVAAEAILADIGFPFAPRPFRPVLRGVLLTEESASYLQADVGGGEGLSPRAWSLWWPPSKIAGRYLSPYLHTRAGAPRTPELRPEAERRSGVVPIAPAAERR